MFIICFKRMDWKRCSNVPLKILIFHLIYHILSSVVLISVKTNLVMNGASESGAGVTFPCFYWNVTHKPDLKHNYIHSERPPLNAPGGFLTQTFLCLKIQRRTLYNIFHCKALIRSLKWTQNFFFIWHKM